MTFISSLKITSKNNGDSDANLLNLADPSLMKIVKREGNIVPYDKEKIYRAVGLCFISVGADQTGLAKDVTDQVDTILRLKSLQSSKDGYPAQIGIESIQDIVETQLMALGQYEAAKHYILYRDERRRVREEFKGISPEMKVLFSEGLKTFTGTNRLLQEVQAFDKFSRFRRDFTPKRRETWPETCKRVMDYYRGHVNKVAPGSVPEETWAIMHDYLLNHKATGSMRSIQMAGPALERCQSGVFNCLRGDTRFITSEGVRFFDDFSDGDVVKVLTHTGSWKKATVRCYGEQMMYPYVISRGRTSYTVYATRNHQWLLTEGDGTKGVTKRTTNLKIGDKIVKAPTPFLEWNYGDAEPFERLYWAYGYAFGDGTLVSNKVGELPKYSMVRLCGLESQKYLYRFEELGFKSSRPLSCGGDAFVYTGKYLKTVPDIKKDGIKLLRAFVRGYLDADGGKISESSSNKNLFSSILVTGLDEMRFVRDMFPVVGVYITREEDRTGEVTNLGVRGESSVFGLLCGIGNKTNGLFSVQSIGEEDEGILEDAWCLEVEDDHSFVLDGGLVTGNCSFLFMDSPESMSEDLYLLMQGCGVGYSIEEEYAVDKWPRIHAKRDCPSVNYTVEDDTEAWCDGLKFGLYHWMDGVDVNFDLSPIRSAGSILKTKGGRASGPRPLSDLLKFNRDLIFRRQKKRLRSIDLLDMTCMLHRIGQMGGVRRASGLSLSDKDDLLIRHAKMSEFLDKFPWRNQANNSAAYEKKPSSIDFMDEWVVLAKSGSGERGVFNRGGLTCQMPLRRARGYVMGTNPCLTGETAVLVADGRGSVTIKELAGKGDDVPVFCVDLHGKIQIRYMRHPRVTGYHEPIYKVIMDDGCSVRVTGKHRFMLKDRTYCEAKGLKPGMRLRLMTRYTPENVDPKSQSRADRYRYLGMGGDTYWEHEMIAEFHAGRLLCVGEHVHHKDENRLHNYSDNLEIKQEFEHLSEHSVGGGNPNSNKITNDELLEIGRNLTKSLGHRFSAIEWMEFAKDNNLPQVFSSWRSQSMGNVTAFPKKCAILEGLEELADIDPRVVKTYKKMIMQGLDAEIVSGCVFIHKKCEGCGNNFTVPHGRLEVCFCSVRCSKTVPETEEVRERRLENQAKAFSERRKELREKQLEVFSFLRNSLGRIPQKKEWVNTCKLQGVSSEICRQSSPFISWKSLTEAGVDVNHRVVSVELDGYEDVYNGTVDDFHNFCVGGWDGGVTAKGRRREWWCVNAQCGEIILRDKGFCNLSIAIVEIDDTYEEIEKKVEIATIWGTIQASMTNFRYLRPGWKLNCEDEALLGVDILGHMDCKLLKPGAQGREEILQKLLKKVQETNIYWAKRLGIKPGAALTCGKPSGDSSVFFDKPAGLKPHHGRFWKRRLRFEETNPIAKVLKDAKIPWQYDYDKTGMCVFEFPCRAPDDTIVLGDMTAVEQLENWKTWKVNFTEHNPSATISVKEHEWIEAGSWVYQNWDIVGGLSFFPYDDSIYPLTPYQTISEQEYIQCEKVMPKEIDWSRILLYEEEDETTLSAQIACTGPGCDT